MYFTFSRPKHHYVNGNNNTKQEQCIFVDNKDKDEDKRQRLQQLGDRRCPFLMKIKQQQWISLFSFKLQCQ